MATIKEIFLSTINEGLNSAELVSEPKDKAMAYAEIAKALAMTGMLLREGEVKVTSKDSIKEEVTKKEKPAKKKQEKTKKVVEETKEEVKEEIQVAEEIKEKQEEIQEELTWDDVTDSVNTLNGFIEENGEDAINEAIKIFSEGVLHTLEDISPNNIEPFANFLTLSQQ